MKFTSGPPTTFVATFVGNPPMNVLRAVVDGHGLQVAGVSLPLPAERRAACLAADDKTGVRPEDVRLVECGEPETLVGEVYVVEPMGNETLVELRVGDERLAVRALRDSPRRSARPSARRSTWQTRASSTRRGPPWCTAHQAREASSDRPSTIPAAARAAGDPTGRSARWRRSPRWGTGGGAQTAGGKVIIGAFADGGLTPFKSKIIPLAKSEAGFDVEFLEDEYGDPREVVRRCPERRRAI